MPFIGSIMSNYPLKAKGTGRKYIKTGLEFYTSDMGDSKLREAAVRVVILRLFIILMLCHTIKGSGFIFNRKSD
jgi:hypothetical protein